MAILFFGTVIFGGIFYVLFGGERMFLSMLLGFLLSVGLFALLWWITDIWKKRDDQKRAQAVENNTWQFPVDRFRNRYVALVGKIPANIKKESDYQRAVVIAQIILAEHNVDKKYYGRYTSKEALARCFAEIARKNGTYPSKVSYETKEWELTSLTDSRPNIHEKDLIGRDKPIYYLEQEIIACRQEINEYKQKISNLVNGAEATYQLGKQQESSWAVHGGIADGIAGPAAGVAVAMDVASKNASARQHNEALRRSTGQMVTPAITDYSTRLGRAEDRLKSLTKSRTDAIYKLVEFLDEKSLLAQLKPTATIVNRSGNTVELKVTLHSVPNLVIYDDIPASVDGSINIRLRCNGYCVGTATCIFPFYGIRDICGIRDGQVNISCSCRVTEVSDHYMFEFVPNHLWAIERP